MNTSTITDAEFDAHRASPDYQSFLVGELDYHPTAIAKAQAALNAAEAQRRISAAIAVRAKMPKIEVARLLGVSRPTLDSWLAAVEAEQGEMDAVLAHERFVRREMDPTRAVHSPLGKARRAAK